MRNWVIAPLICKTLCKQIERNKIIVFLKNYFMLIKQCLKRPQVRAPNPLAIPKMRKIPAGAIRCNLQTKTSHLSKHSSVVHTAHSSHFSTNTRRSQSFVLAKKSDFAASQFLTNNRFTALNCPARTFHVRSPLPTIANPQKS